MQVQQLKTLLETSTIDLRRKRVLVIYPPTTELLTYINRTASSCHQLHADPDSEVALASRSFGYGTVTDGEFPFVLLTCPPSQYLSAVPVQSFDVIIWFDYQVTPDKQKTLLMAQRSLAWNGKMLIMSADKECGPDLQKFEFNSEATTQIAFFRYQREPGFLLASYARCGTHMLRTAIDRHPELNCVTEVFHPGVPDGSHLFPTVSQTLETFWGKPTDGLVALSYIGIPGAPPQLGCGKAYQSLWDDLPTSLKVISVRRRNLLARHVSHLKANQTNVWNRYNKRAADDPVPHAVEVDFDRLIHDVDYVQKCWRNIDSYYPDCLTVFYEDMVDDFQRELKRVHKYLGVKYEPALPLTAKLSRPLEEDISNYDALMSQIEQVGGMRIVTY